MVKRKLPPHIGFHSLALRQSNPIHEKGHKVFFS